MRGQHDIVVADHGDVAGNAQAHLLGGLHHRRRPGCRCGRRTRWADTGRLSSPAAARAPASAAAPASTMYSGCQRQADLGHDRRAARSRPPRRAGRCRYRRSAHGPGRTTATRLRGRRSGGPNGRWEQAGARRSAGVHDHDRGNPSQTTSVDRSRLPWCPGPATMIRPSTALSSVRAAALGAEVQQQVVAVLPGGGLDSAGKLDQVAVGQNMRVAGAFQLEQMRDARDQAAGVGVRRKAQLPSLAQNQLPASCR